MAGGGRMYVYVCWCLQSVIE